MADVESERRQDITPMPDADPLLGSVASEVVRYLASFAMTAVATVVAVGVGVSIPSRFAAISGEKCEAPPYSGASPRWNGLE